MTKYILTKEAKGKKFQYTVTDENGNVISTRMSTRDYVACTANGEYYFGRLDLIGKGDHGRRLNDANEILMNPQQWKIENPFEEWIADATERAQDTKSRLEPIAYLK